MITTDNEKKLSSERYDAKLFNQVYRANLKAKSAKQESDLKKKKLLIYIGIGFVILAFLSFLFFKPKSRENYVALGEISGSLNSFSVGLPMPKIKKYRSLEVLDLDVAASSVLVFDLNSGLDILTQNVEEKHSIASLTKLVTAMVMIDTYGLDYQLEITKDLPEDLEWTLELEKGDVISTDQLLRAMLIGSYNDAAYVVANEYGFEGYLELMNRKVKDLGCENTHFDNPMGYDSENHFSTAHDFKKIVNVVLKYPSILEVAGMKGSNISWISGGEKMEKYLYTTNQMILDYPNVRGLKTGFTTDAGRCLITLYDDMNGKRFVIILLNSEERFEETKKIIDEILY